MRAVAQVSKQAFCYVFDRVSGEPVWPIEERPVPGSNVPGEKPSPTQPFPTRPAPFDRQGISEDDLTDWTPELRRWAREASQAYLQGPLFTPPSEQGTLTLPGPRGSELGGGRGRSGKRRPLRVFHHRAGRFVGDRLSSPSNTAPVRGNKPLRSGRTSCLADRGFSGPQLIVRNRVTDNLLPWWRVVHRDPHRRGLTACRLSLSACNEELLAKVIRSPPGASCSRRRARIARYSLPTGHRRRPSASKPRFPLRFCRR